MATFAIVLASGTAHAQAPAVAARLEQAAALLDAGELERAQSELGRVLRER